MRNRVMQGEVIEVEAAGGLVYSSAEKKVLLIKRNGSWDIPKGKLENDESIESCAIREVCEETGVCDIEINSYLGETLHTYERENITFKKRTYWFSMDTLTLPKVFKPQTDEGITMVKWVDPLHAESMVDFDNLKQVIRTFKENAVKGRKA